MTRSMESESQISMQKKITQVIIAAREAAHWLKKSGMWSGPPDLSKTISHMVTLWVGLDEVVDSKIELGSGTWRRKHIAALRLLEDTAVQLATDLQNMRTGLEETLDGRERVEEEALTDSMRSEIGGRVSRMNLGIGPNNALWDELDAAPTHAEKLAILDEAELTHGVRRPPAPQRQTPEVTTQAVRELMARKARGE